MNIFYMLDPTSLAVVLPSILLWALIFISAGQKRYYPWPTHHTIKAIGTESVQSTTVNAQLSNSGRTITISQSVCSELLTYIICVAFGSGIFIWCSTLLLWRVHLPLNDLHAMIPAWNNMWLSLFLTYPILWGRRLALFRTVTRNDARSTICSSQFIFSMCILIGVITLTLLIIQLLAIGVGLSTESARVMRSLFNVFVALSAIPSSIAGIAVASSGVMVQRRKTKTALSFLNSDDVSRLDFKTVEELNYLIEVATKHGKIDNADWISKHLLRRVENS